MNAGDHEQLHRELGVYVLGALEPAERDRVERHLTDCDACRDELASLAGLPSLLAKAFPPTQPVPAPPPIGPVVARIVRNRRRERRRNRMLVGAAAAAALTAVVLVAAPFVTRPPTQEYVADIAGVTASVEERRWGMAVSISAERLPDHEGYVAVAVAKDGHRTQVASWNATGGPATIEGACYLPPEDMDRMEVLGAPGEEVVAVLRPAH